MDSVTQIALGAAVGEAVMQNKVGRKAALWGAICGTLPDLDVFIPLGDPVSDFTYHRAASHSFFFMTLATPLLAWIIMRIHPKTREYSFRWPLLVWLALITHALLDSFTVYGTQIFLPFSNFPVGWSTIFVIDPLYTLPLLMGALSFFYLKRNPSLAYRLNMLGLILSTLYLVWSIGIQTHVSDLARKSLQNQNIHTSQLITGPAPFNTLLWRIVAMTDSGYAEGFYSILDEKDTIHFTQYRSENELLNSLQGEWAVKRLQWFSKGFYKASRVEDDIIFSDLRMGLEPLYFFSFSVGKVDSDGIVAQLPRQVEPPAIDIGQSMTRLWYRMWDENILVLYEQ
jgi:inner membrane protein